ELILEIREGDCAERCGDDDLLRLEPFIELEAGRRQVLEQALEFRLVARKVGARRMGRDEAPEIERLAALEAVDAEVDQRLFDPAAEVEGGLVVARSGRFEAELRDLLLDLSRYRAVAGHIGRDRLLRRSEIDR